MHNRILLVGDGPQHLNRQLLLESSGNNVVGTMNTDEAVLLASERNFDLVIVCSGCSRDERARLRHRLLTVAPDSDVLEVPDCEAEIMMAIVRAALRARRQRTAAMRGLRKGPTSVSPGIDSGAWAYRPEDFVHVRYESAMVVATTCRYCGTELASSPDERLLRIVEEIHICPGLKQARAVAS